VADAHAVIHDRAVARGVPRRDVFRSYLQLECRRHAVANHERVGFLLLPMLVQVDESRSDYESAGVDDARPGERRSADRLDAATSNADGSECRQARTPDPSRARSRSPSRRVPDDCMRRAGGSRERRTDEDGALGRAALRAAGFGGVGALGFSASNRVASPPAPAMSDRSVQFTQCSYRRPQAGAILIQPTPQNPEAPKPQTPAGNAASLRAAALPANGTTANLTLDSQPTMAL
jgi:hypothetical protein